MRRLRHETDRASAPARENGSVAGAGVLSAAPRQESPLATDVARTTLSPQLLHDLRSPLNHIIGYSEMLTEEAESQRREGFATDIEKIRAAGQRMLALIEANFTSAREAIPALIAHETAPATQPEVAALSSAEVRGHLLVVDD